MCLRHKNDFSPLAQKLIFIGQTFGLAPFLPIVLRIIERRLRFYLYGEGGTLAGMISLR